MHIKFKSLLTPNKFKHITEIFNFILHFLNIGLHVMLLEYVNIWFKPICGTNIRVQVRISALGTTKKKCVDRGMS